MEISIHALLAESDVMYALIFSRSMLFLSTLSLRRATKHIVGTSQVFQHFYPRSPCGERLVIVVIVLHIVGISIHALLAESDSQSSRAGINKQVKFLSTLSLRRATLVSMLNRPHSQISIHALLAESDREIVKFSVSSSVFLSTLSLRRAT